MTRVCAVLAVLVLLAACGKKGDPVAPPSTRNPAPAAAVEEKPKQP